MTRLLVLPRRIGSWSQTRLPQRLVGTGGRLLEQARYSWLLLVECPLTRRLFGAMLGRIAALHWNEPTTISDFRDARGPKR
jgi:hypothetical protein